MGSLAGNSSSTGVGGSGRGSLSGNGPAAKPQPEKQKGIVGNLTSGDVKKAGLQSLGGVLDILGRPGAAVLSAGRAGREARDKTNSPIADIPILNEFAPGVLSAQLKGGARGITGKEHLTPTEATLGRGVTAQQAFGSATTPKGIAGRTFDFTLGVASDPTTILTSGSKEAAQAGLKGLEETAARRAIAKGASEETANVARQEIRKLAEEKGMRAAIKEVGGREAVRETLKDTARTAGVNPRRTLGQVVVGQSKDAEAGAERFANRALRQAERSLPETAIGQSTIKLERAAKNKVGTTASKLGNTSAIRAADRAFHSDAALKQVLGKEVAGQVKNARMQRESEVLRNLQDYEARARAGLKEAGDFTPDGDKLVLKALETPNGREILQRNNEGLLPVYDALHGIRKDITAKQVFSGAAEAGQLHDVGTYAHRELTREARRAVKQQDKFAQVLHSVKPNAAGQVLNQGGALKARELFPELSITEANKKIEPKLRELGLLKEGEHFFKEEAVAPTLRRAETATKAVAEQHYVDNLMSIKDGAGNPILKEAGEKVPAHWDALQLNNGRVVTGPKEVIEDLRQVESITTNSDDLKAFNKLMQGWTRFWKQGATTFPVTGAFTARNARSNVFLNYLGGVKDARDYAHAGSIQKKVFSALRAQENRKALIAGDIDSVLKKALGPDDYKIYRQAQQHDVIGSTFSSHDLNAMHTTVGSRTKNPWTKATRAGAKGNQVVEENARLAHFIAKINQGGDPNAAALSVKKYLFDYGDLSEIEKKKLKTFIPFYTFMRKNTPLQIEQLIKQPGKYTLRAHAAQQITTTPDEENTPRYLQNGRQVDPAIAKLLGISADAVGITSPDSPLAAAEDQGIRPVTEPLSLIPGVRKAIPKSYRAENKGEAARTLANIASGPQLSALKYLTETGTGKSLFTGANLKQGNANEVQHALTALTPAFSRGRSTVSGLSAKEKRRLAILNLLTGLKVTENE